MHHSQAKNKFNILDELEGALKRKAAQRQRSRDSSHLRRNPNANDQRKSKDFWSITNRPQTQDRKEQKKVIKPVAQKVHTKNLFSNEGLQGLQKIEMKQRQQKQRKSSINKRLEKLGSLIGYAISSAEKAIKYVNLENFEAEFAVKLFRSDKENVLNEMQILMEMVLTGQTATGMASPIQIKSHASITNEHILKAELSQVKKLLHKTQVQLEEQRTEKLHLMNEVKSMKSHMSIEEKYQKSKLKTKEKQIGNLLKQIHEIDQLKKLEKHKQVLLKHNLFLREKEVEKLKRVIRSLTSNQMIQKYFQTIEKETKFNLLIFSNFENSRKRVQLEQILKTLEIERLHFQRQIDELNLNMKAKENDVLKRYVKERLKPELGIIQNLEEVEILQKCIQKLRQRERRQTNQHKIQRLQGDLDAALNQKASLENKFEMLKLQKKDSNDIPVQIREELDLLKQNIDQIYEELLKICHKNELIDQRNEEVNIEQLLNTISSCISTSRKKLKEESQSVQFTEEKLARVNQRYEALTNENLRLTNAVELLQFEKQDQLKVRDLQKINSEMRSRLDGLEREKSSFQKRISEIKERNEELRHQNSEKERKLNDMEEQLLINNKQKYSVANEYERMREVYDKLVVENEKLKLEIEQFETTIEQLKEEIEDHKKKAYSQVEVKDEYQYEINYLKEQLNKKVEQIRQHIDVVERLEKEQAVNSSEITQLTKIKHILEQQVDEMISDNHNQIQSLKKQNQIAVQNYVADIRQLQELVAELQQNKDSKAYTTANLESKLSRSNKKIQEIVEEQSQYVRRVEELTREVGSEKQKLFEVKMRHEEEISNLLAENHQLKQKVENNKSDERIQELEERVQRLECVIEQKEESINRHLSNIQEKDKAILYMQTLIIEQQTQIQQFEHSKLQKSEDLLQSSKQDPVQQRQQVELLMNQLTHKESVLFQKEMELMTKEKDLQSREERINQAQESIKFNQDRLLIREQQIDIRSDEVNQMFEQNSTKERDLQIRQLEMDKLQNQVNIKFSDVKNLQQNLQTKKEQLDLKQNEMQTRNNLNLNYFEQNKILKQKIQTLQQQCEASQQIIPEPFLIQYQQNRDASNGDLNQKILQLESLIQLMQARQHQHISKLQQLRSQKIEDSRQIVDLGVQAYIPDEIIEGRDPNSGEVARLQNMLAKLNTDLALVETENSKLKTRLQQKDLNILRLNQCLRVGHNQIRLMESNIQYLNQRLDDQQEHDIGILQTKHLKVTKKEKGLKNKSHHVQIDPDIKKIHSEYSIQEDSFCDNILNSEQNEPTIDEIKILRQNISALKADLESSKKKYTEYKEEKEIQMFEYQNQIENNKRTIQNLKMAVMGAQSPRSQGNNQSSDERALKLQKQLIDTENKVMSYSKVIQQKEEKLANYDMQIEKYRIIITELKQSVHQKSNEVIEEQQRLEEGKNTIEELKEQLNKIRDQFDEYKSIKQQQQNAYMRQIQSLKIELNSHLKEYQLIDQQKSVQQVSVILEQVKKSYENYRLEKKVEIENYDSVIESMSAVIEDLKSQLFKSDALKNGTLDQLSTSKQQYVNLQEFNSSLQAQIRTLEEKIFTLNETIEDLKQSQGEADAIEDLRQVMIIKQQTITKNNGQLAAMKYLIEEQTIEINELKQVVETKDGDIRRANDKLENLRDENSGLKEENDKLIEFVQQMQNSIDQGKNNQSKVDSYEEQIKLYEIKIQELTKQLDQKEEIISGKVAEIDQLNQEIQGYKSIENSKEEHEYLYKKYQEQNRELLEELNEKKTLIETMFSQKTSLEREIEQIRNGNLMKQMEIESCAYLIKKIIKLGLGFEDLEGYPTEKMVEISLERVKEKRENRENKSLEFSQSLDDVSISRRGVIEKQSTVINETQKIENKVVYPVEQTEKELNEFSDFNNESLGASMLSQDKSYHIQQEPPKNPQKIESNEKQFENNPPHQKSSDLAQYINSNFSQINHYKTENSQHVYTPFETHPVQTSNLSLLYSNIQSAKQEQHILGINEPSKQSFLPSTSNVLGQHNSDSILSHSHNLPSVPEVNLNQNQQKLEELLLMNAEHIPFQVASHTLAMYEDQQGSMQFTIMTPPQLSYQFTTSHNYEMVEKQQRESISFKKNNVQFQVLQSVQDAQEQKDDGWIVIHEDPQGQVQEEPFIVEYQEEQQHSEFANFEQIYNSSSLNNSQEGK